jgi:hypothetical protein
VRRVLRVLVFFAGLAALAPGLIAQGRGKVLLIAREHSVSLGYMLIHEVKPMTDMLQDAGFEVVTTTDSGTPLSDIVAKLDVNLKLSDVVITDYVGVVIPCMLAGDEGNGIPVEEEVNAIPAIAVKIVMQAAAIGLPIAAQESGVEIVSKADILKGKNYAAEYEILTSDGNYKGSGVVQDGNIVTSGICPFTALKSFKSINDGTNELMTKFIAILKPKS